MPALGLFKNSLFPAIFLLLEAGRPTVSHGATPADYGVMPVTETIYVNIPVEGEPPVNNSMTESIGIAITSDGNVVLGWEDDGEEDSVSSHGAIWTLFNKEGERITPLGVMKSTGGSTEGQEITGRFRAFFRRDGSAVPGHTAWGPKIKANLFGAGFGMGANGSTVGQEIPELRDINLEDGGQAGDVWGDFPVVQLLDGTGAPLTILSGASDEDAQPADGIRIADWEYLSNGNIVTAGESRQNADLADRFGGVKPDEHAVYRIVNPRTGTEVKSLSLVGSLALKNAMWHGLAVTRQGFATRSHNMAPNKTASRSQVRFFDNEGTPLSENIDLAELTKNPDFSKGGRGPDTGFHGNGRGAVVFATVASEQPLVAVLHEDGSLKWWSVVAGDLPAVHASRTDAAIDEYGRICVVFDDSAATGQPLVMARIFDAAGAPLTGSFYVSELEMKKTGAPSFHGRVSWRGGRIAIAWESQNSPAGMLPTVAARFFQPPEPFWIIQAAERQNGGVSLHWTSAPLNFYAVESSPDLTEWTQLAAGLSGPGYTLSWEDLSPAPPAGEKRFYRVRLLPHQPPAMERRKGRQSIFDRRMKQYNR